MDATTCVGLPTTSNFKCWYLFTSPTENLDDIPRCIDYRLEIRGSSFGLICFSIENLTIIWNPLTRIYQKLPPFPFLLNGGGRGALTVHPFNEVDDYQIWGFGYDDSSADFKVLVRVHSRFFKNWQFQVYCVQANTSRVLEPLIFPMGLTVACHESARTPLNGALHWLTSEWNSLEPQEPQDHRVNGIVAFDLEEESFWDLPLADCIAMLPQQVHKFLAILDGRLCACYRDIHDTAKTEIWVMKEYGVKESWAPWISVAKRNFQPIYVSQNKEILALTDDGRDDTLVAYNPTHKTYRLIKTLRNGLFCGVVYEENFVALLPKGGLELIPAIPRQLQPTSYSSFVTKGPITNHMIKEDDFSLYAKIDLPGVDTDGLKVMVYNKFVILIEAKEGGKDPEFDMEGGKETRKYYLGIKLHCGLEDVKWSVRNGVLKLVVLKSGIQRIPGYRS